MEILHGESNWKLTIKREKDHIIILRAITCDSSAILPEELFGLPVTVLGDHALAPDAAPVKGEELQIVCGREGEWDNRNLRDLTLPPCLTDIKNYAIYGCRNLHTLRLNDGVLRWGGGSITNCRSLRTLHLTRVGEKQGEALAFICGEIQDELEATIYGTDGSVTRLVFPDYAEAYEENFPNHHFDYHINGGGYPYHHTFPGKQLSLRTYDELWDKYLRERHEPETALRLAYYRLRYPNELADFAREQYTAYLRKNARDAILWQLHQKDAEGLGMLLKELEPEEETIHAACDMARREGNTEALALLLEKQHKSAPRGLDKDFDL